MQRYDSNSVFDTDMDEGEYWIDPHSAFIYYQILANLCTKAVYIVYIIMFTHCCCVPKRLLKQRGSFNGSFNEFNSLFKQTVQQSSVKQALGIIHSSYTIKNWNS